MKPKLITAIGTALAVAGSAWLGFQVGRNQRPPLNLTITVFGDIMDHDGLEGIGNGLSAKLNDVEFFAAGPLIRTR